MSRLTRAGYALLTLGLGLFTGGVAFGNFAWLLLGALPIVLLLVVLRERPAMPFALRGVTPTHPRRGDAVDVRIVLEVPAGRGIVEVHQALPGAFDLVEGSNVHLLAMGPRPRRVELAFSFRAAKRGRHEIPPLAIEVAHPLGLLAPESATAGATVHLEVAPRVLRVGRLRVVGPRGAVPGADAARGRSGAATTDFREVREYRWGDAPRSINWKASARRMSLGAHKAPLVNEHEPEGRSAVWVLVDASTAMEVGTTLDNGLEHALEAASGVAAWFLDRGYRVGAYVYNARDSEPVYADTGRRQLERISSTLVRTVPAPPAEGLDRAVQRCRAHLIRDAPHVVLITRVGEPAGELLQGLRALRRLAPRAHRRAPVTLVDVRPHRLQPSAGDADREAAELADGLDGPAQASVRRLGARHLRWDPARGPFASVFLRGGFS